MNSWAPGMMRMMRKHEQGLTKGGGTHSCGNCREEFVPRRDGGCPFCGQEGMGGTEIGWVEERGEDRTERQRLPRATQGTEHSDSCCRRHGNQKTQAKRLVSCNR